MIDLEALLVASHSRVSASAAWAFIRPYMSVEVDAAVELHAMVEAAVAEMHLARAVVEALRVFQDDIEEDRTETMHALYGALEAYDKPPQAPATNNPVTPLGESQ